MVIGSGTELQQTNTVSDRLERQVDVLADVSSFHEGVKGGQERCSDGLKLSVGFGERRLEGVHVGEKGSEVIHGLDEVLVVRPADLLDFRLLGAREMAEVEEQRLGLARSEGLADKGSHILAVRDGRGEEQLVEFLTRISVIGGRRSHFTARFCGVHRGSGGDLGETRKKRERGGSYLTAECLSANDFIII